MNQALGPAPAKVDLEFRRRALFAAPLAVLAIGLIALGGIVFAVGLALLALPASLEMGRLLGVGQPLRWAAAVTAGSLVLIVYAAGSDALAPGVAGGLAVILVAAASGSDPGHRAAGIAGALLTLVWVGGALAHGALLRELPHGGALVVAALLATFLGDTAAHLIGARYGRRRLAPRISPGKTLEGLLAGLLVGPAVVVVFALVWQDWLELHEALLLGVVASLAAPAGDLSESMLKRAAAVKHSGTALGPHGGVLDRIDAALFTSVAAYYAAAWLL